MKKPVEIPTIPLSADPPKDPPPQTGTDTAKGDRGAKITPKK